VTINDTSQVRTGRWVSANNGGGHPPRPAFARRLLFIDGPVVLRKSGLAFSRPIPLSTWELIGQQLLAVANTSTWWLADWLAYGEQAFQDRYREAIQKTSLNYQTLRNYAWVARRLELDRRRDGLSFGHHAEVAALDAPEQGYWLRKAEESGWSRNQLRAEIRASLRERHSGLPGTTRVAPGQLGTGDCGPEGLPPPVLGMETLYLRFSRTEFARLSAVARKQNLAVDEWAVQALREAATARNERAQHDSRTMDDRREIPVGRER
jgi:hypothetical protein